MKKLKKISINILIFFVGLLVGVLLLEFLVKILPQEITKIDNSIPGDERIYSLTRFVKFKHNFSRVWTGLGPPTIWHYNNLGFRDRPVSIQKPENVFRVVVIGDSIVMGFGVEDFESFPRDLEQILKPQVVDPKMKHFEVINMGIQGYSSPQYLALLQEEALKLNPDLVIVTIYPSNDLLGGVSFEKDKLYRKLMAVPDFIPFTFNQTLKEKSKLYLFLLTKYYTLVKQYESSYKPQEIDTEYGLELMRNDVINMQKISKNKNIPVVFLVLPHPKEVKGDISYSENQKKLIDSLKYLQVLYYDSFADLQRYSDIDDLYMDQLDDHFSPKGNKYFATLLAKFLWDNKLVPKN